VEPRGEDGGDRRRDGDVRALAQHREQLLEEERVSLRNVVDPRERLRLGGCAFDEISEERSRLALVQRAEQDRRRVQLAAAPGRARLEQFGAGEADEENRRFARVVGKVLDELEQRRLGPVHVLEDENERGLARGRLEQLADRAEGLLLRQL